MENSVHNGTFRKLERKFPLLYYKKSQFLASINASIDENIYFSTTESSTVNGKFHWEWKFPYNVRLLLVHPVVHHTSAALRVKYRSPCMLCLIGRGLMLIRSHRIVVSHGSGLCSGLRGSVCEISTRKKTDMQKTRRKQHARVPVTCGKTVEAFIQMNIAV